MFFSRKGQVLVLLCKVASRSSPCSMAGLGRYVKLYNGRVWKSADDPLQPLAGFANRLKTSYRCAAWPFGWQCVPYSRALIEEYTLTIKCDRP